MILPIIMEWINGEGFVLFPIDFAKESLELKRRRIWISSPIYYIMVVAMLCMAGQSVCFTARLPLWWNWSLL